MFKVGDKIKAFGVEGVVQAVTDYNVMCEFKDMLNKTQYCVFSPDGRLFEWANEPSLESEYDMPIKLQDTIIVSKKKRDDSHWKIGKNYFIRTVTHHLTGKLVKVTGQELVLIDAAWIADDGRFMQAIKNGELKEVEPFPDGHEVIVGRGSLIDACLWDHALPREQK